MSTPNVTRPPARVRISGFVYRVLRSNRAIDKAAPDMNLAPGEVLFGYSDATTQEIAVRADLSRGAEQDTFLHEVIHQLLRATACDPSQYARDCPDGDVEEYVVKHLSRPLLAFLRDNPRALAYLLTKTGDATDAALLPSRASRGRTTTRHHRVGSRTR